MSARRLPIVAALVLGLVALVVIGSNRRLAPDSVFADLGEPGMPVAPAAAAVTTSWFCPGVPASERRGGDVIVTNPGDNPLRGTLTVFSTAGPPTVVPVQVAARDSVQYRLEDIAEGDYLSGLVEIDTGLGFAEQRARHPNGDSLQPCSNVPSSVWYLADGITEQAGYDLVITNPFPDYTNVSITIATEAGLRTPSQLQSLTIPGRSVYKVDLEAFGLRDEPVVSISVEASPHRVVVGRAQNYLGGQGRGGYSMTLGAPSLDTSWFFPDGEQGSGIQEELRVYNPTDAVATVTLQVFTEATPDPTFVGVEDFDVDAGSSISIDVDAIEGMPEGRHSLWLTSDVVPVVAEQVITRDLGATKATAVVMGTRVDATRWWVPTPVDDALENGLVVSNLTALDGTVTVYALGPGGTLPVEGLTDLALPAAVAGVGGTLVVDLTSPEVVGKPLLVVGSVEIAVSRRPDRGGDLRGRSAVLALPELGS